MDTTAMGGLLNMGNTCYANATLQAFRHCKRIPWLFDASRYTTLLSKHPGPTRAKQEALARTFAEIVQFLNQCKKGQGVRPGDFWKKFHAVIEGTGFEQFRIKLPHDSHEFYLCLLDHLHEAVAQPVDMRILKPEPTTDVERRQRQAIEVWRQEFEKKYSPLVDLFYGLTHVTVECQTCKHVSHRWETFSALKAGIPHGAAGAGPVSLQQMLEEEFKPEEISEYVCEKCAPARQPALRRVKLWRLPLYLVIVIKRFTPDGRKISTPLAPLPLQGEQALTFTDFFSPESPERDDAAAYRLNAIVDHHGGSGGGHYTAQARHVKQSTQWTLFDDETAHPLPNPMFGPSNYMLWLERVTI